MEHVTGDIKELQAAMFVLMTENKRLEVRLLAAEETIRDLVSLSGELRDMVVEVERAEVTAR